MDLVGYSDLSRAVEQGSGSPEAVAVLNRQIEQMLSAAVERAGMAGAGLVVKMMGDGAILVLPTADGAHQVAQELHEACAAQNATATTEYGKRLFRSGASTGEVAIHGGEIAGSLISTAVRLQTAAGPGELLIDPPTLSALSPSHRSAYGIEEQVPGKRNERFAAHRCLLYPAALPPRSPDHGVPRSSPGEFSLTEILDGFDALDHPSQLDRLLLLIKMPSRYRPPANLAVAEREAKILEWAVATDNVPQLSAALRGLLERQRSSM